eukprot:gene12115-14172_t
MSVTLKPTVAPSLLSGDFAFLARDANYMVDCGADWLHMDVMDKYVSPVIKSLRKHTKGFLDCHLMVSNPETMVEDFKNAGADSITFHLEATERSEKSITMEVIDSIKKAGMKCALSIKPNTPVDLLYPFVEHIDFVLIMTVEPGFGGQLFMASMMPKVEELRKRYPHLPIQVDGGIDPTTIETAAKAGANIVVAGSALFKPTQDPKETIKLFKDVINKHQPQQ